jgi:outer membrane protein TolC
VYDFSHERFERLAVCQVSQARQAELAATHDQRLFQAASNYYDLVGALAAIHVAKESLRRGEALLEYERALLNRGKGLEAEVARSEAFRAAQAQSVSQAMAAKEIASVGIATQLRLDPLVPLQPVEEVIVPVRLVDSQLSRQELITMALNKRPELREAGWLLAAAQTRQSGTALKPYLPVLAGEAKIGAFGGDAGSSLQEFDDRQDYRLSLQWTADHLGKGDQARLEQEAARTGEAQVRRQQISDHIVKEVLEAWANACSAEERMELARTQVEASGASLSRSESRLRSGVAIPYEVIQAQEDLVRAETNHIRSIIEYNRAELDLLRSLGSLGSLL